MKIIIIYFALFAHIISTFSRIDAVKYAKENYNKINHTCGDSQEAHKNCNPFSYFGNEHCNYPGDGGDCANFVSQCLVKGGGHEDLYIANSEFCRGYPCGFEEISANRLGNCLEKFGWNTTCDKFLAPPKYINIGDVLIYHEDNCNSYKAHACIITEINPNIKITCRSEERIDDSYTYNVEQPYYEWLHYIDENDDEYIDESTYLGQIFTVREIKPKTTCRDTSYSFYIYGEFRNKTDIFDELIINLETSSFKKIRSICAPHSFESLKIYLFDCEIDICMYPLDNVNLYLPIKAPESSIYKFKNWKKNIGEIPGETNKISEITCLPSEINTFIPSSIKIKGCSGNKNVFTISGEWLKKDETLSYLYFSLVLSNENDDIASCETAFDNLNEIECEYEGEGDIVLEEQFFKSFSKAYKIKKIDMIIYPEKKCSSDFSIPKKSSNDDNNSALYSFSSYLIIKFSLVFYFALFL